MTVIIKLKDKYLCICNVDISLKHLFGLAYPDFDLIMSGISACSVIIIADIYLVMTVHGIGENNILDRLIGKVIVMRVPVNIECTALRRLMVIIDTAPVGSYHMKIEIIVSLPNQRHGYRTHTRAVGIDTLIYLFICKIILLMICFGIGRYRCCFARNYSV